MERFTINNLDKTADLQPWVTEYEAICRLADYENIGLEPEEVKEQIGFLSPICIGCPGKKDGVRTELCDYEQGDMTRCLEQVRWLRRLAEDALRREQE